VPNALERDLAGVPPELEWLANITNSQTRRAYKIDVKEFSVTGLRAPCAPESPALRAVRVSINGIITR